MLEPFHDILEQVSRFHLNILLLLGLSLFGGIMGGRLFQKLRVPQVVGHIMIGIVIGQSGLNIIDEYTINVLEPFNYFALGLIGFMIGGELKKEVLQRHGKQFLKILLCEGLITFLVVFLLVGLVGTVILGGGKTYWLLGLLLGAIASATAPAATTDVLREYKTRGPLTTTVLGIVALDDVLALFLFSFAASIAGKFLGNGSASVLGTLMHPFVNISTSLIIGSISGWILSKVLIRYVEKDRMLAFSIGAVLSVIGVSIALKLDMLLSAMMLGAVVVNLTPRRSKEAFQLVGSFTPPIYVLFFVLVGAKLNLHEMSPAVFALFVAYLGGRTVGKIAGARLGTKIANAPLSVQRYLPLCLFSQAGVAIGLAILASHTFSPSIGNMIVIVVTTTTFIVQLLGPPVMKIAITRAGEVGLNVTEEDLISSIMVREAIDQNYPLIHKNMALHDILEIFSRDNHLYYPVVDDQKKLLGIISVENVKQVFMDTELGTLVVADDLMEPVIATTSIDATMSEVWETLHRQHLEYLPVVNDEGQVKGFIENRLINKLISTKLMELQKKVESLE